MSEWFQAQNAVVQAILGGGLTWFITALGASLVFFTRRMSQPLLDAMLGFAAGVMIAASVWSLLLPAIELAEETGRPGWAPAAIGFLLGAAFLRLADFLLPHLHLDQPESKAEGFHTTWRRTTLLVLAITLHNIPEGLAVGVAFGAAAEAMITGDVGPTLASAIALTIGIALQNLPEGIAVAMPLRREGIRPLKAFWYGQLSAAVEPIAAAIGAAAVIVITPILPYALAFAAGAMIFVVVEELIPESQRGSHADLATSGTIVGFIIMMILDVALG
ncbi:ZIP family metal transporter [Sphaerobacter sp.]|uniref:ZIP family metal transporter n=1 Tax=Sphaerobacter sp. TaxID=2099654 RepID=UPI001E003CA8|nr:ZIP family metal transporter [Sphaerobacter sp.]MBX5445601.1 ZIP family metal transporter [Sphaerobacter sp.]